MVVAGPKLIQKDYNIIWCCVLLCYGSLWFKFFWYVNDEVKDVYEMIMKLVEQWNDELAVNCDKLRKVLKLASH